MTTAKIELGRHLFHDNRLSANEGQSCSSCHIQEFGFAEPRRTSIGSTGQLVVRNSPGLGNAMYYSNLTWASRALTTFEQQMLVPLFSEDPIELGVTGQDETVLTRFRENGLYRQLFADAYPDDPDPVSMDHIIKAIASFLRTMVLGQSPWDRATYANDDTTLSDAARRGAALFFSERLECHHCHGGFNFTQATQHADTVFLETAFHNTGLYDIDGAGAYPASNTGLFETTGNTDDMGRFRAPSLHNVAVTPPYFHDGSAATLEEVLLIYEAGGRNIASGPNAGDGRANPLKSGFIRGFTLTDDERADVIAFLESLTDDVFLSNPRFASPFEE
jgi:cytochrome c peroxidase